MNRSSEIMKNSNNKVKTVSKKLDSYLKNDNVSNIICGLLIVYSIFIVPRLSIGVLSIFDNLLFRLFMIVVIVLVCLHDPIISLLMAIAFVVSIQRLSKVKQGSSDVQEDTSGENSNNSLDNAVNELNNMNNINNVDNSMNNENLNNVIDHTNSIDRAGSGMYNGTGMLAPIDVYKNNFVDDDTNPSLQLSGNFNGVGGRSSVVTIGDKLNDNGMSGIKADLVENFQNHHHVDRHDVNDPAIDVINNGIPQDLGINNSNNANVNNQNANVNSNNPNVNANTSSNNVLANANVNAQTNRGDRNVDTLEEDIAAEANIVPSNSYEINNLEISKNNSDVQVDVNDGKIELDNNSKNANDQFRFIDNNLMDSVKHPAFNTITENVFTTDAQFKNAQSDQVPESNYDGQIKTFTTQHGAQGLNNPSGIPGTRLINTSASF